ncbi:MAG: GAF domain-containing protein [Gammaproteobacteria bacterium]|nr:GAF domain-containing protein [Gammaproteobacteria bacterium]
MTIDNNTTKNSHELTTVLINIMQRISQFMQAERATLFLYDKENNELWSKVLAGDTANEIRFAADQGLAGEVLNTGAILNINDAYADERFNQDIDIESGFKTKTVLCMSLTDSEKKPMGVIQVLNKNHGVFTADDEKLLAALIDQAAMTIENSQLYQDVNELKRQLELQHRELQTAYTDIEASNTQLQLRLNKRKQLLIFGFITSFMVLAALWIHNTGFDFFEIPGSFAETIQDNDPIIQKNISDFEPIAIESQIVEEWLTLVGVIEPLAWQEINSPLKTKINSIHFTYGDEVKKDQILMMLDVTEITYELREAKLQLAKAKEELQKLRNWRQSNEVVQAQRDLNEARDLLSKSDREYQKTKKLFDLGIVSANELEGYADAIKSQKRSVDNYLDYYNLTLKNGDNANREFAMLQVENVQLQVNQLTKTLENANVRSPFNGIVFRAAKTPGPFAKGDLVALGLPLLAVVDLSGITLNSAVKESKLRQIEPGQYSKITLRSNTNIVIAGQIKSIANRAFESSSGNSLFKVVFEAPKLTLEQKTELRIGMSATAQVKTHENPNAIIIPFDALLVDDNGDSFVNVLLEDKTIQQREVSIRSTQYNGIEISSGLQSGETILLPKSL